MKCSRESGKLGKNQRSRPLAGLDVMKGGYLATNIGLKPAFLWLANQRNRSGDQKGKETGVQRGGFRCMRIWLPVDVVIHQLFLALTS